MKKTILSSGEMPFIISYAMSLKDMNDPVPPPILSRLCSCSTPVIESVKSASFRRGSPVSHWLVSIGS